MRARRTFAQAGALIATAALIAAACTSSGEEPPEPTATVSATGAAVSPLVSQWVEATDVLGAPGLVSDPDPAKAPVGVDTPSWSNRPRCRRRPTATVPSTRRPAS